MNRLALLFGSSGPRYRGPVLPLGFKFDIHAVVLEGVAHDRDCE